MSHDRDNGEPPKRWHARRPGTEPLKVPPASVDECSRTVYLAAPLLVIETAWYDDALRTLRDHRPGNQVLGARDLFRDTDDWKAWWPDVLATIDELVFITCPDGTIGAGVVQEALDATLRSVPVSFLDRGGTLHRLDRVTFRFIGDGSPSRIAEVLPRSRRPG
jgi:hypothetical protein